MTKSSPCFMFWKFNFNNKGINGVKVELTYWGWNELTETEKSSSFSHILMHLKINLNFTTAFSSVLKGIVMRRFALNTA